VHAFVEMAFGHFVSSVSGGIWCGAVVDVDDRAGIHTSLRLVVVARIKGWIQGGVSLPTLPASVRSRQLWQRRITILFSRDVNLDLVSGLCGNAAGLDDQAVGLKSSLG